jgi:hypothetical protein
MRKFDEEALKEAIRTSFSIAQVLRKLGCLPSGGNYFTTKKRIVKLQLDTSHFTGKGHLKGKSHNWSKHIPLNEILVENSDYHNATELKKRLIREGLLENKCAACGLFPFWNGKPLVLHLDHINGINIDQRIENLQLLCPNCHSQTSTYAGRNMKRQKILLPGETPISVPPISPIYIKFCEFCHKKYEGKSKRFCSHICYQKSSRKVPRPPKEELEQLIHANSFCKIAKIFNVSDSAVRNWVKQYGIKYPKHRKGYRNSMPLDYCI